MRKIKRKKGYAGKMQEKIFEQIRMNEIIEKKEVRYQTAKPYV